MTISPAALIAVDVMTPGQFPKGIVTRIASAVRAAHARSLARHAYKQMLQCEDHILRDIGVTRADVRQALRDLG